MYCSIECRSKSIEKIERSKEDDYEDEYYPNYEEELKEEIKELCSYY